MIGSNDIIVRRSGWRRVRAAVLFPLLGTVALGAVGAAPVVPNDATQILERLPPRAGEAWDGIRTLHSALAANPAEPSVAAELAQRYLILNRSVGDPRLVAYASHALAPWDGDAAPPVEVALERALIAQTEHRFDAARAELRLLLERAPRSAQAWLALAALDTVQGRYADAKRSCAHLVLLQDATVAGACFAAVQAVTGEAAAAYRLLTESLARPELGAEMTGWLATLAAETAERLDLHEDADRHYRTALAASGAEPTIYMLTAYADFLLRRARPTAVIALLEGAPPADPVLLRLALAEIRAGRDPVERIATLRYRLELARIGADRAHAREAAFFALYIDADATGALTLALDNWTVQREPIDARLVLEAAMAAKNPGAARPVRDWLASHGTELGALMPSSDGWRP